MLPKQLRLDLRRALPYYTFPHKFHQSSYSLYWCPQTEKASSQAAVVVSKKVAALATDRNRVKRVVRTLLPPLLNQLPSPVQLVVVVKQADIGKLRSEIETGFQQKLLKVKQ